MNSAMQATENRALVRHVCDLEARVFFGEKSVPAITSNISIDGGALVMLSPVPKAKVKRLSAVAIDGLGYFECVLRWQSDRRIGVQFKNSARADRIIGSYLRNHLAG